MPVGAARGARLNRVLADQAELEQACLEAWNTLTPERIKSLCRVDWLPEK